ncbi:MAG: DUF3299 domain-containing protein [Candidatus Hydrogenedentes bacterium]|nr:DUF3299 domain-containing protein [Candidatus Hydrogenedentota bacterium]
MRVRKWERLVLSGIMIAALTFAVMPWWRQIRSWLFPPRPSPISVLEARLAAEKPGLLTWELLRQTKGSRKVGPQFPEDLAERDGQEVVMAGYMAPLDQYEAVERFVLLPRGIECIVCECPPSRDQMLVQLDRPAELLASPVVVNGKLTLHSGKENAFFYSVSEAAVSPGFEDQDPVPMVAPKEHRHSPEIQGPAAKGPIRIPPTGAVARR